MTIVTSPLGFRTETLPMTDVSPDIIPVPVERFESGYKPTYSYRVDDAYMWQIGPRRWRLRYTTSHDTFTDHRTLKDARREFTRRAGLDLRQEV